MIVGFYKPTSGEIFLDNKRITPLPMFKRAQLGISYLPQEPSVFKKLTVEENIWSILETRKDLTKEQKKEINYERIVEILCDSYLDQNSLHEEFFYSLLKRVTKEEYPIYLSLLSIRSPKDYTYFEDRLSLYFVLCVKYGDTDEGVKMMYENLYDKKDDYHNEIALYIMLGLLSRFYPENKELWIHVYNTHKEHNCKPRRELVEKYNKLIKEGN